MLRSLTGLRGIAAYAVLVAHAITTIIGGTGAAGELASRLAWFGMTLFFVLSGFVIYYNYGESFEKEPLRPAALRFFAHRFARIYPLYLVSLLIVLVQTPATIANVTPLVTLTHLTLTQSWFNFQMAIFAPAWSISTEWFFYVAFIPMAFVLARVQRPLRALLLFSAVSLLAIWPLLHQPFITAQFTSLLVHGPASTDAWSWFDYFNPYLRVLEFIAGALAARAYAICSLSPRTLRIMTYASALWCLIAVFTPAFTTSWLINVTPSFFNAPAIAVLLYACSRCVTPVSRVLGSPVLVFLGTISYSAYVWSWLAVPIVSEHLPSGIGSGYTSGILHIVAGALATTLVAFVSYRLIEEPSRRGLRFAFDAMLAARKSATATP